MTDSEYEDLKALMEEPPGGLNHGRRRTGGNWRDLETEESFRRSPAQRNDLSSPIKHGTVYAYNRHSCRCRLCRDAIAAYRRQRRFNLPVLEIEVLDG